MEDLLALLSLEPRVYLLHRQADADAVGAAVALSRRFPGVIAGTGSVSAAGTRVAERFGAKVQLDPPLDGFAVGIAVDVGSPSMLGPLPKAMPLAVIDHHREGNWDHAQAQLVDPDATSTCEVVLKLLWALGEGLQPDEALAMMCGLVADTQRFRLANKDTLGSAFVLMESGAELPEAIALLEQPAAEERSERIARLRAAQRAEVEEMHGLLVARTHVNSYEASAAQGLVHLGADVALAAAQRDADANVSARVRRGVPVDAARLMQRAAAQLGAGWGGGGHAGAAGLSGKGDAARALQACVAALREAR